MAADGHSYERDAIERWFSSNRTSPCTNLPVNRHEVIPNILASNVVRTLTDSGMVASVNQNEDAASVSNVNGDSVVRGVGSEASSNFAWGGILAITTITSTRVARCDSTPATAIILLHACSMSFCTVLLCCLPSATCSWSHFE